MIILSPLMDAKNIFIACGHRKQSITWEKQGDSEWTYIGVGEDYKEALVAELVAARFREPLLYLVSDRNTVHEVGTHMAAFAIGQLLPRQGLTLTDKTFTAMMEFNKIGVVKISR